MDYTYTYFVASCVLMGVWLGIFVYRTDLRQRMAFGTALAFPFGFTDFLYVPEYWNPPSLFDLVSRLGFGIESLTFSSSAGGIATVIYEVIVNEHPVKQPPSRLDRFVPYAVLVAAFLMLESIWPERTIYNLFASFLAAIGFIVCFRPDLCSRIAAAGLAFGGFYFLFVLFIVMLYPGYIDAVYNVDRLLGRIWGVPCEEILFGVTGGACWVSLCEYRGGRRLVPRKLASPPRWADME